jgi:plasmid stabilization system protein ParE
VADVQWREQALEELDLIAEYIASENAGAALRYI